MKTTKERLTGHLGELRSRLLRSAAAVLAAAAIAYFFSDAILAFLIGPIRNQIGQAYYFSPADAFMIKLNTAVFTGLLAASPYLFSQIWSFVAPGLYESERKTVLVFAAATTALFWIGVLFAFFAVVPPTLEFLLGFSTDYMQPMITVDRYLSFVMNTVLGFGIAFNLPVLVGGLAYFGLVDAAFLKKYRKHMTVVIFIAAAVLTPSPDILSQVLLGLPLMLLYEASIWVAAFVRRRTGQVRGG